MGSIPDRREAHEALAKHLAEMEMWLDGRKSHINALRPSASPFEIAVADAAQASAEAAAATAWAALVAYHDT